MHRKIDDAVEAKNSGSSIKSGDGKFLIYDNCFHMGFGSQNIHFQLSGLFFWLVLLIIKLPNHVCVCACNNTRHCHE